MDKEDPTYHDKLERRLKNNKFVAALLIISTAILASLAFIDSIIEFYKKNIVEKPPEIRTRYYTIKGHGLSMFLDGYLDQMLQRDIGGKPIIWKNEIYDQLSELHDQFAKPLGLEFEGYLGRMNDGDLWLRQNDVQNQDFLPGTYQFYKRSYIRWDNQSEHSLFVLDADWDISIVSNPNDPNSIGTVTEFLAANSLSAENVRFNRSLDLHEANLTGLIDMPFYQYVLQDSDPEDFFSASLHYEQCGDMWTMHLRVPLLTLKLVVVENISGVPITLNKIAGILSSGGVVKDVSQFQEHQPIETQPADGILKSNERLVIPTGLVFEWESTRTIENDRLDWEQEILGNTNLANALSDASQIRIFPHDISSSCPVTQESNWRIFREQVFGSNSATQTSGQLSEPSLETAETSTNSSHNVFRDESNSEIPDEQVMSVLAAQAQESLGSLDFPEPATATKYTNNTRTDTAIGQQCVSNFISERTLKIDIEDLSESASRPPPPTREDYYLASLNLDSIEVNGRDYAIRPDPLGSIFIYEGSEAGSCPYLYAKGGESLGKILTGRESLQEAGIYTKQLRTPISAFTLKEIEKETTFIKWVRLKCKDSSDSGCIVAPNQEILQESNEDYLVLNQGDSYDVDFAFDTDVESCVFQAFGYYLPDNKHD